VGASWYAMDSWLSTFAYRIELGVAVFVIAGGAAAAIAWATVSYHFIKAARANPSDSLRYE
jgi:putative ABC transport system permease protein